MSADTVCRVCLMNNLNLYGVRNELQNAYERITREKFNKVGYPVSLCYICLSVLRKCNRFMETARASNRLLEQWHNQQTEMRVTKPLVTYSINKLQSISIENEDIFSERLIKTENVDLFVEIEPDYSQECQIPEVKSEIETYDEIQLSSGIEVPIEFNTDTNVQEPYVSDSDNTETDDVYHTENISKNTKPGLSKHKNTRNEEGLHTCDICNKSCRSACGLRRHILVKHQSPPTLNTDEEKNKTYSCNECTYTCFKKYLITKHMTTHACGKLFSCHICGHKCAHKSNLTRHMTTHLGEKPFSCTMCSYKCAQNSNLTRHMRTHTGERPFSCDICGYKFIGKSDLARHMRTHTGKKPFSCDLCSYKCIQKAALTKHNRIHTGEKPYSCDMCSYKCVKKSRLNQHLLTKHEIINSNT